MLIDDALEFVLTVRMTVIVVHIQVCTLGEVPAASPAGFAKEFFKF